jgi:hypothetical protein
VTNARPALLFMRELPNAIEHPEPHKHEAVRDFHLLASGQIHAPSAEVVIPGETVGSNPMEPLMAQLTNSLLSVRKCCWPIFAMSQRSLLGVLRFASWNLARNNVPDATYDLRTGALWAISWFRWAKESPGRWGSKNCRWLPLHSTY